MLKRRISRAAIVCFHKSVDPAVRAFTALQYFSLLHVTLQWGHSLLINVLTLDIKFTSFPFTLAWSFELPKAGSVGALPQPTVSHLQSADIPCLHVLNLVQYRRGDGGRTSGQKAIFREDSYGVDKQD